MNRWDKDRKPDAARYVGGEGPVPCEYMLIGDHPGIEESWAGRPFVGRSGRLMDQILQSESLWRGSVYCTNVVKYYTEHATSAEIRRDRDVLMEEMREVQPRWVGLMGALAVRTFMGPGVQLEWAHGLAFPHGPDRAVMPMYNPAFGLRDVDSLPLVRDDFRQFKLMIEGKITPRVREDEYPSPRYVELKDKDARSIAAILAVGSPQPISVDTEGWWHNPWGLSFCVEPGEAFVIHRSSKAAIEQFAYALKKCGRLVRLHNSLHDLEVLRALGITGFPFVDTMIQAYHLCLEPQGLKPLARRHCGMEQDEYAEITGEASRRVAIDYLERAYLWANKQLPSGSSGSSKTSKAKRKTRRSMSAPAGKR